MNCKKKMAIRFQVSFIEVVAVVEAEEHFPPKTPKRWHLIAEYTGKMNDALKEERGALFGEPTMLLGSAASTVKFDCCAEHCKQLCAILSSSYKDVLRCAKQQASILFSDASLSAFKPVVLLPKKLNCCGHPVSIK